MSDRGAAVVAFGAISSLGEGAAACGIPAPGEPANVGIGLDEELSRAGLARPFAARADVRSVAGEDRAAELLRRALTACVAQLDATLAGWRGGRVGLALATSAGGMRSAETFFTGLAEGALPAEEAAIAATYFGPMVTAVPSVLPGMAFEPATLIVTACAASTLALGLGLRWLQRGACDLVLAGGFDAVSLFVASGFEALRATTAAIPPRPFARARDGMALGEGAAVLALVAPGRAPPAHRPIAHVVGFGASSDAVHITAPDRTGDGLLRAAKAAIADARVDGRLVGIVSAHATATPFNDAAEMRAIAGALGGGGGEGGPVIHPAKAQLGHTLGAAGALETLGCALALARGVLPATPVVDDVEPDLPGRLAPLAERGAPEVALKLSSAFGGANASLVVTREPLAGRARPDRAAYLSRAVFVGEAPDVASLAARTGHPIDKLARGDGLVRLAIAAVADLADRHLGGPSALEGAGIVVGHAFATVETNAVYHARLRERGPRAAEPRRFPYTTPNAVAGECGVVFRLTGPGLAVASGLHGGVEALGIAVELVRSGDVDRVVVVAVDEVGAAVQAMAAGASLPAPPSGAVALLVSAEPTDYARVEGVTLALAGAPPSFPLGPAGHTALRPLTADGRAPTAIASVSPWGSARVTLALP